MNKYETYYDALGALVGKTVESVVDYETEDEEGSINGFVVTCTDGTQVRVGIDYDDADLVAERLQERAMALTTPRRDNMESCKVCKGEGKIKVLQYYKDGSVEWNSTCDHCKGTGKEHK